MIASERHTESQSIKAVKARKMLEKGYSIYAVSELLNVGFAFLRRVCRDMPGGVERDFATPWLPEDDDANVGREGVGYWVPSPDEIAAMMDVVDAWRLAKFEENSKSKRDAERYARKKQEEYGARDEDD